MPRFFELFINSSQAAGLGTNFVQRIQRAAGVGDYPDLTDLVFALLSSILVFTAVIGLIILVFGGFRYLTSLGDEEKARQAKQIVLYAVIGMAVIMISGLIINYVILALQGA